VTPGVRGALAAFIVLFVFAFVAAVVALVGLAPRVAESRRASMSIMVPARAQRPTEIYVGGYRSPMPRSNFERGFLTAARREWVRKVAGYHEKLSLKRRGKSVSVLVHGATLPAPRVARAVQEMLALELGYRFRRSRIGTIADVEFARRIAGNPPPD